MEATILQNCGYIFGNECDSTAFNISHDNSTLISSGSENIFIKPGPIVYYTIGSLMACVMIIGFSANLSVLYAYAKIRQIRTTDNTLVIGLVLSDIGQSILGIPFVVIACFSRKWIFGHVLCQFYAFITTSLGISQITTLTLIATERFFIIVQRNRRLSNTQRKSATVMACSFLYGSAWATGPLLGWSNYKEEEIGIACCVTWEVSNTFALSYTISLCTIGWLLPLMLIAYGYISIAISIHNEQSKRQYLRSANFINKNNHRERRVAITILMMIGAFVVSWMPYSIVSLWSAFGDFKSIPLGVQVAPAIFAKCSIIWNPMIYVARHKHFRKGVKRSVPCMYFLSPSRSVSSDVKHEKHETHTPQQKLLSVPEKKEDEAFKFTSSSSDSSEMATNNKTSIACSTYKTSSVWIGTPTSIQRLCAVQDDESSSSEADSTFYDDIISEPSIFQHIGTQTDTPSPLRASFKQYLQTRLADKQLTHTDTPSPLTASFKQYLQTRLADRQLTNTDTSVTGNNTFGDVNSKLDMMNSFNEQDQLIGQTIPDSPTQDTDIDDELHTADIINAAYHRRYASVIRHPTFDMIKGRSQLADVPGHSLTYMNTFRNSDYIRHKTRYRIASEPVKAEVKQSYIELNDFKGRQNVQHTSCTIDNEHQVLIRQTTL